jgi:hypothetical protein
MEILPGIHRYVYFIEVLDAEYRCKYQTSSVIWILSIIPIIRHKPHSKTPSFYCQPII